MARRKQLMVGAVVVAILASVAVIGVPAGWYGNSKVTAADNSAAAELQPSEPTATETPTAEAPHTSSRGRDAAALVAKRQREKERGRTREEKAASAAGSVNGSSTPASTTAADSAKAGPKKVVVTVTYDESGRVTQASGADATALRIARQKRFPAGKSGSATITIPLN